MHWCDALELVLLGSLVQCRHAHVTAYGKLLWYHQLLAAFESMHSCYRLAMLGVVAALTAEVATNKNVFEQVQAYPGFIAFTFLLWITATLVPILRGTPRKGNFIFTSGRELINGRIAMLGFVALIATEYFSGGQTIPHFYGLLK